MHPPQHHQQHQNFNHGIRAKTSFQMKHPIMCAPPASLPLPSSTTHFNNNNNKRRPQQQMMINNKQNMNKPNNQHQTIASKVNEEQQQNNLNKLKICMEANRRNINQRLNINNNSNSNGGGQMKNYMKQQQQQQQNENNNGSSTNRFQNNKQLIVIKTGENDDNSIKTPVKRPLSDTANESEAAKKVCPTPVESSSIAETNQQTTTPVEITGDIKCTFVLNYVFFFL